MSETLVQPGKSAATKTLVIQPVTRIEGHAKVTIDLDETGNVSEARVNVIELRGFEKFCIGRPVEEMPRITTRICGVCPWSHHLASGKATDAVFGVEIPPAARKLRELCNSIAYMEEHILHFYFLAGADFVIGPDADPSIRNVLGIVKKVPDVARRVVQVRHMAAKMLEILAGKAIHPDAVVPGGFSKPLLPAERDAVRTMAVECLDLAKFSIDFARKNIFPAYLDVVKALGVIETGFLGTVKKDGALSLYDGQLRLMTQDGSYTDFAYDQYTDYIGEHVEPWSYLKFPYDKRAGAFSMDLDQPNGIYRANTLARINVCDYIDTPLAQAELEEFRASFGRPAQLTLLYHWARLIELLYNAENAMRLLDDPEITSVETRKKVEPRAARGVGCVEAPRGTLIHDYTTDENGMLTNVNLIVGTTHNNAPINMSVKQAAKLVIKDGHYDQGILNRVEMAIRAYDPCLSCATHTMDGTLAVRVDIRDSQGSIIDSLTT
ncbi:MAG: Ni/Fe hydrogenase subunit alpha [Thermoanaerobaculia bacterium]